MKKVEGAYCGWFSRLGWTFEEPKKLRRARNKDLVGRTIVAVDLWSMDPTLRLDDGREIHIAIQPVRICNRKPTAENWGPEVDNSYNLNLAITSQPVEQRMRITQYQREEEILDFCDQLEGRDRRKEREAALQLPDISLPPPPDNSGSGTVQ